MIGSVHHTVSRWKGSMHLSMQPYGSSLSSFTGNGTISTFSSKKCNWKACASALSCLGTAFPLQVTAVVVLRHGRGQGTVTSSVVRLAPLLILVLMVVKEALVVFSCSCLLRGRLG